MLHFICDLQELKIKNRILTRFEKYHVLALYWQDRVWLIENRCPHEGYPMSEGSLNPDCQITCNWHNWKFRLEDGSNLLGGEAIKTWTPVIKEDKVFADLKDTTEEEKYNLALKGLKEAIHEINYFRLLREWARVLLAGLDPLPLMSELLATTSRFYPDGLSHAHAALPDWMSLPKTTEETILCLAEASYHLAFDQDRYRLFHLPESVSFDSALFLQAIELEQSEKAIGLLMGALEVQVEIKSLQALLTKAALNHYNDFGHSLIYVQKVFEWLPKVDPQTTRCLLALAVQSICLATREDCTPEFRRYRMTFEDACEIKSQESSVISGRDKILYPKSIKEGLTALMESLKTNSIESIYISLLEGLCLNFWHYQETEEDFGWLDLTHGLTFASALRHLAQDREDWIAGLIQMSFFHSRAKRYLGKDKAPAFTQNVDPFFWKERVMDHRLSAPVFSAHLIKTSFAMEREALFLEQKGKPEISLLLRQSLALFLNSDLPQRRGKESCKRALQHAKKSPL